MYNYSETKSKKPDAEVVFAFRMFMARYHLTPSDILKILVALENND